MDDGMLPPNEGESNRASSASRPMLDDVDSQQHQQNGSQGRAGEGPPVSGKSAARHDLQPAAAKNADAGHYADREKRALHSEYLPDLPTLVALSQLAIAACTLGTLVVTGFQLSSMQEQIEQVKVSNYGLERSIAQATRQADAAEKSNKLNEEALSSADRAWLGVTIDPVAAPQVDQDYQFIAKISNIGKTPALDAVYGFEVSNQNTNTPLSEPIPPQYFRSGTIFPNHNSSVIYKYYAVQMSKDNVEKLVSGINTLRVRGTVSYKDINLRSHITRYCASFSYAAGGFVPCDINNENSAN